MNSKFLPVASSAIVIATTFAALTAQDLDKASVLRKFASEIMRDANQPNHPIIGMTIYGNVSEDALKELGSFRELRSLTVITCIDVDIGLEELSKRATLRSLYLEGVKPSPKTIKAICAMTELRTLELGAMAITDENVKELNQLKNLQEVILDCYNLTDKALGYLSWRQSLRKLGLAGSKVTDAGAKQLGKLSQLESLDLVLRHLSNDG